MTTKADEARYAKLREIGCIACRIAMYNEPCGRTEIHHLVDLGYRALSGGNLATIPLGRWHHQGIPLIDRTVTYMRGIYGPSMKLQKKEFTRVYGTQRELLAMANGLIEMQVYS